MSVLDIARVMIYRVHEKGMEIFLLKNELDSDPEVWKLPKGMEGNLSDKMAGMGKDTIDIESTDITGKSIRTLAIEGDWHDIPSIRGMLKHDIKLAKKIVKEHLPESEKGTYFAFKECFKKMLPHEYEAIKELKDIITDRNTIKNM